VSPNCRPGRSADRYHGKIGVIGVILDYPAEIERVYRHIEDDCVAKAAMGCLRIARQLRDYLSACIFLREMYLDNHEFARILYQDTNHLKPDVQKFLHERSLEDFLNERTLPFSLNDDNDEARVLAESVGELDTEVDQLERSIADLSIPSGMTPFDTAAFFDRYAAAKARFRIRIKAVQTIRARIKTRCLNYVIGVEKQLEAQAKSEAFLHTVQNEVNNYFKAHSDDVYTKLQKAAQLVDSADSEDCSLLLTLIRRSIKAVADYFYPAVPGSPPVTCVDGVERKLGDDQYLNRLQEYMAAQFPSKGSSADLVRAETSVLMAFARKLNDKSSKGVHGDVTPDEARQGLFGLYMLLYNVTAKLQTAVPPSSGA